MALARPGQRSRGHNTITKKLRMMDTMLEIINVVTNIAQLVILIYLSFLVIPKFYQKGGCNPNDIAKDNGG